MPKEIRSAADILGTEALQAEAPAAEANVAPAEVPVVETPPPSVEAAPAPAAGFETPPAPAAEAPSAEAVIGAAAVEAVEPAKPKEAPDAKIELTPSPAKPPGLSEEEAYRQNFDAGLEYAKAGGKLPADAPQGAIDGFNSFKPEPVVLRTEWRFVKNIHPGEKITFKDGTEYKAFTGSLHSVRDPVIAEKILEVADRYHIVLQ